MQTKLELYQRVTPLAGLGIWERNLTTGEIYWNEIVRQILEVEDDFFPELEESINFYKNPDQIKELLEEAVQSEKIETAELELITAKGNTKWVKVRIQAENKEGKCVRIYGTLEDITENVRLVNILKEREDLFSKAFNCAPIGMALVSLTGAWIKVNHSLCKLMGYSEEQFTDRTFGDFTHPDDLAGDLHNVNLLINGDIDSYSMEKRYFHADGHIIWALLSVAIVKDEAGKPLYFISQIKDITEHKKSTQIIRDQNERLLNFTHIVSHNLRSHTGNIKMLTDMIMSEPDAEEKANLTQMLDINAGNLLETLNHLNEVIKIQEAGATNMVVLNLKYEIHRVLQILSPSITKNQAKIKVDINEDITVRFCHAYLESILINLIDNSIKYKHRERHPEVYISAQKTDNPVVLKIKDNGLGIDLSLHGHKLFGLYKTFHKHDEARGVGLFLTKNQIEAMGGNIRAESEIGAGTTFIIEFN